MSRKFTIDDLNNLSDSDIWKMSEKEMQDLLRASHSRILRRVKSFEKSRMKTSYPVKKAKKQGLTKRLKMPSSVSIQVRRGQLYNEIRKNLRFIRSSYGSVKSYKALNKNIFGKIGIKGKIPISLMNKFWKVYEKLYNSNDFYKNYLSSSEAQSTIYNILSKGNNILNKKSVIEKKLDDLANKRYKDNQNDDQDEWDF